MMFGQGTAERRLASARTQKIGLVSVLLCLAVTMPCAVVVAEELVSEQQHQAINQAQLVAAEESLARGDFVTARELVLGALTRDPNNAAARVMLSRIDSQLAGTPTVLDGDPVGGDLRQQSVLAEARLLVARAELLASGDRYEAAIVLLSQARVSILPHAEHEAVRSVLQRIDATAETYRDRLVVVHDRVKEDGRDLALQTAQHKERQLQVDRQSLLDERILRVEELEAKAFYESALAACRRLVADFPDNQRVESLYARLITKAHKQRDLTVVEQRTELLQEVHERIERSLIPQGFDGWPTFPKDWHERNQLVKQFDAPDRLDAWEEALNEKLGTRLSYDFVGQNAIEVLNALAKQANINLIVDPSVLASGDKLVTLKANDITFRNTLSWICRQADTTWHIAKGAVYVGGAQETSPVLAIYEVSDLLFAPKDQPGKQLGYNAGGGAGAGGGGGFNLFQMAAE